MPDAPRPLIPTTAAWSLRGGLLPCVALAALSSALLAGCASAPPVPALPQAHHPAVPEPATATPPPLPQPAAAPLPAAAPPPPVTAVLAAADALRSLSANDLQAEIARLQLLPASPPQQLQLALAWMQARQPGDSGRAAQALQRVLQDGSDEARALHALARLLQAWQGDSRRADEQAERQAQQLREAQRRADQLADRLDALRAIERSRPRSSEVR